jgi:hypothetical protein
MAVRVTARRMVGGQGHQHISHLQWTDPATGAPKTSTRAEMVTFVEGGGQAYVMTGGYTAYLRVRPGPPKYVQTYADGVWKDNLLALPLF